MSRSGLADESFANTLELLARYRELCENTAGLRAIGSRIPGEMAEKLHRLEGELQALLRPASAGSPSPEAGKPGRSTAGQGAGPPGGSRSGEESPRVPAREEGVPSPRTRAEEAGQMSLPATGATSKGTAVRRAAKSELPEGSAIVYTDGACIGNPGPGGYAAIVRVPGQPEREKAGGKARTTNNEMELTAALEGLRLAISMGAEDVTVVSDSEYLVKGMTSWVKGWRRNGWQTSTKTPVKNRELWEELYNLSLGISVAWTWTRGHNGDPYNERADALAVAAAQKAIPNRK